MIIDLADLAVPADSWTWSKEEEKIGNFPELAWELKRIWKVQTSCDWSYGNHYDETQGLLSRSEESCII